MVRIINVEPHDEDNKGFLTDSIGQRAIVAAFHMPGCMYCEMLKEPWNKFTKMLEKKYSGDETIVAFVHKDVQDDVVEKVKGDMFIQGYPTIVGIKKGGSFEEFKGVRSSTSLLNFYKQTCGNKKIKKNRTKKGGSIGSVSTAKNLEHALKKQEQLKKQKSKKIKNNGNIPSFVNITNIPSPLSSLSSKGVEEKNNEESNIFNFKPLQQEHGIPKKILENLTKRTLKSKKRKRSEGGKRKNKHKKTKKSKK
tara:strand:+ start:863 stop:1615 length:753 start_codon:yes stop_codon:yes gene_type:complete